MLVCNKVLNGAGNDAQTLQVLHPQTGILLAVNRSYPEGGGGAEGTSSPTFLQLGTPPPLGLPVSNWTSARFTFK